MLIFQEAATMSLPQLSQSSLFMKFEQQSHISQLVKEAVTNKEFYVRPEDIQDVMALIRLNGSPIAKKAVQKFEEGRMIIIYNKDRSRIPTVLPYIIVQDKSGKVTPVVFADRVVSNINSSSEYQNLMAAMEAAYLAAALKKNPAQFLLNRNLVLNLCELYNFIWIMPLEQKMYIKGDNLTKAEIYITSYFYRMIDGDKMSVKSIPFNRILKDRVSDEMLTQLVMEVKNMPSLAIGYLLQLLTKINPVRYKNLESTFFSYFTSSCGTPLLFALENPQYLFLLISSSNYKTKITAYALNKTATNSARHCLAILNGLTIDY